MQCAGGSSAWSDGGRSTAVQSTPTSENESQLLPHSAGWLPQTNCSNAGSPFTLKATGVSPQLAQQAVPERRKQSAAVLQVVMSVARRSTVLHRPARQVGTKYEVGSSSVLGGGWDGQPQPCPLHRAASWDMYAALIAL